MNKPRPVKFSPGEDALIELLSLKFGIKSRSEIVRRCIRLTSQEIERRGDSWNWVAESAAELDPADYIDGLARLRMKQTDTPKVGRPSAQTPETSSVVDQLVAERIRQLEAEMGAQPPTHGATSRSVRRATKKGRGAEQA